LWESTFPEPEWHDGLGPDRIEAGYHSDWNEEIEMSTANQDLLETVLALPPADRRMFVNALLESLEPVDPDIERAWLDEVKRRWAEFEAGRTRTIPADQVFAELEQELNQL
jgi:putative addiction module component (TIGR02574 family)